MLSVMKVTCHCWRSLLTKSQPFCPYFFFLSFLFLFFWIFMLQSYRGLVTCSRWWAMGYFRKNPNKWQRVDSWGHRFSILKKELGKFQGTYYQGNKMCIHTLPCVLYNQACSFNRKTGSNTYTFNERACMFN